MIEEARTLALRRGPWKYVQGAGPAKGKKGANAKAEAAAELYNLDTDIGEQENVAKENEAIAEEMSALLRKLVEAEAGVRAIED